jgi:hypothetical protein
MRPLLRATAVVTAAIALTGCPNPKEPVPGPKSAADRAATAVSEINWFQGTLEEAFARPRSGGPGNRGEFP